VRFETLTIVLMCQYTDPIVLEELASSIFRFYTISEQWTMWTFFVY
jgi:hypothetical protein